MSITPPTQRTLAPLTPTAKPAHRLAAAGREAPVDERLTPLDRLYDPVSRRRRGLFSGAGDPSSAAPGERRWRRGRLA